MKDQYEKTTYYWNDFYENQKTYESSEPLSSAVIEATLDWLTEFKGRVMDIGCGSGRMALRCLHKGALKIIGVDASYHGISLARQSGSVHFSTLKTQWIWGRVEAVVQLPDACSSGVILSNILEILRPEEGRRVIEEAARVLDRGGRVMLQIHAYNETLEDAVNLETLGYRPILDAFGEVEAGAFTTPEGLFVWNLTDQQVSDLMDEHFECVSREYLTSQEDPEKSQRVYRYQLKERPNSYV